MLLILLTLFLFIAPASYAATLNVGPGQAYATISIAHTNANPGDTIRVHNATYSEQITITKSSLTFEAINQYGARINCGNSRNYGFYTTSNINNITIDGFEIYDCNQRGIYVDNSGASGWIIKNNKIHHIWQNGIQIRGSNQLVQNNIIHNIGQHQEAIALLVTTNNSTFEGNQIYLAGKDGIRSQSTGSWNNLMRNNIVWGASQCFSSNNSTGGDKLYNNYGYECNVGIEAKHNRCTQGDNAFYYFAFHNTVYRVLEQAIDIGINTPETKCIRYRNNVLDAGGYNPEAMVSENTSLTTNIELNSNFYDRGSSPFYSDLCPGTCNFITNWDTYRSQTGYEAYWVDPQVAPGYGDAGIINHTAGTFYDPGSIIWFGGSNQTQTGYGRQLGAHNLVQTVPYPEYLPNVVATSASAANNTRGLLTDLNSGVYWQPNVNGANVVFRLNNGNDATFEYFSYHSRTQNHGPIQSFQVQTSETGTGNWTTVLTVTASQTDTLGGVGYWEMPSPVTTKYVRWNNIVAYSGSQSDTPHVSEVRFFTVEDQGVTPPPALDVFFVNNKCANNGDGTSSNCASTPGAAGPWNTIKNAMQTANCAGMGVGDVLLIDGNPTADLTCQNGGTCYFEDNIQPGSGCNDIVVQNVENEHVVVSGTTDIKGSSWTSIGSGVYECQTPSCSGTIGNSFAYTAWYDRGAGEERLNLIQTVRTCDTSLAAGFMRIDHTDQSICVHLSDGSSPANAAYFRIPSYDRFINGFTTPSANITIRKNPTGTGSFNVVRYREKHIELGADDNPGWVIDGLNFEWALNRCIEVDNGVGVANLQIINNTIAFCGEEGIRLEDDIGQFVISGNTITDIQTTPAFQKCDAVGADCLPEFLLNGNGIRVQNLDGLGGTISDNLIFRAGGGNEGRMQGINILGHTSNVIVERNYVAHMANLFDTGVAYSMVAAASGATHDGTIFRNNRAWDVDMCFRQRYTGTLGSQAGTMNYFVNNTCVDIKKYGIQTETEGSGNLNSTMIIRNNIFESETYPPILFINVQAANSSGWAELKNNSFYCANCTTNQTVVSWKGTTFRRAGECETNVDCIDDMATILGAAFSNNVYGDANLITFGTEPNLKITGTPSVAVDAGLTIAQVTDDYLGTTRPFNGTPDIGAHEFTGGLLDIGMTTQKSSQFYGKWGLEGIKPLVSPGHDLFGYINSKYTLRFSIACQGGDCSACTSNAFVLYARKCTTTCGPWQAVTQDSSSNLGVYIIDNPSRPSRQILQNTMDLGGLTFRSGGRYIDNDTEPVVVTLLENEQMELEYSLAVSTGASDKSYIEHQVRLDSGSPLDAYTVIPKLIICNPGGSFAGGIAQ